MLSCPNCGSEVTAEDRFCGNCGSALPAGAPAGAAAPQGPAASAEPPAPAPPTQIPPPADMYSAPLPPGTVTERRTTGEEFAAARVPQPSGEDSARRTEQEWGGGPESQDLSDQFQPTIPDAPAPRHAPAPAPQEGAGAAAAAPAPDPQGPEDEAPEVVPPSGVYVRDLEDTLNEPPAAVTGDQSADARSGRTGSTDGRKRASSVLEPETLLNNRYQIVRKIGGGGMGAVYYAKDRNLGDAPRAVKEMIQSHLDESQQEKAVADFKRESMLLASLEHPSIPTIYDYFYDETAGRFYLVMKYISGGDFLARLRNAPHGWIEERVVADWAAQAADVLDYLHNQRPPIIYRDLKPANLMIDGNNGRVMLIDFGIARWVQKEEKGVTAVGTMGYAPPELFSGKVEPRSDVYSLGATMFHLLTGADPQDNPLLIFDFTKNPRPREINPSISNEMELILMRAVEYGVESRFRSAAELRDTLYQHAERLRAGAVTYGAVGGAGRPGADAQTVATETVFCGFCGKSIAADDVFCAHCGARQPIVAASASLRAARATARLVVSGTTELDSTFMLHKDSTLVGRTDPQSNIFPDVDLSRFDPETKISRRHARVFREGDMFLVEDLGSVNGTVLNDAVKLGPRQPRQLANGDRLRLGETTLHFLVG